jgi:hypothetical protein
MATANDRDFTVIIGRTEHHRRIAAVQAGVGDDTCFLFASIKLDQRIAMPAICQGRIGGRNGAVAMLNLKPGTRRYRMRKLDIEKAILAIAAGRPAFSGLEQAPDHRCLFRMRCCSIFPHDASNDSGAGWAPPHSVQPARSRSTS